MIAFTGGSGATNTANMFIALKPLSERKINADLVIGRIRKEVAHIAGVNLYLQAVQDLRIGGRIEQRAVSVHAAERRPQRAEPMGAEGAQEIAHRSKF